MGNGLRSSGSLELPLPSREVFVRTSRDELAVALSDRYTLGPELGRGGMGSVYAAQDLRHARHVAIKVLHAEIASSVGVDRFQREIRLAARLQHPHILTVFDSGEAAGCLWFTMPLVEGESLRERLKRNGPLPVDVGVRIAVEVAEALDYAHSHGVLHRDIKPENILLSNGHAVVADFGIARPLGENVTSDALTATGSVVGTPAYMSPEQASGELKLDGRTDIYSLGCVLYEMLSGVPPFSGANAQAVVAAVLTTRPRPLSQLRPVLPWALSQIVDRATAPAAEDRYPQAAKLAQDLLAGQVSPWRRRWSRRRAAALAATAGVGALGFATYAWSPVGSAESRLPYLAVLPFRSDSATNTYLADGLADQVRGKLAALGELAVIARSSTDRYRATQQSLESIASDLGATYVLTGQYRRGDPDPALARGAVAVELLRVERGRARIVWTETIAAAPNDFGAPSEIAGGVVRAMGLHLTEQARNALAVRATRDSTAWNEYLRGSEDEGYIQSNYDELPVLEAHFQRAVQRDSMFGEAWARLAITQVGQADTMARVSIERALQLNPDNPETVLALALYEERHGDHARAHVAASRALRAHPNDMRVLMALGRVELSFGRFEEALRHFLTATRLDPQSALLQNYVSNSYSFLRRPREAQPYARRAVALDSMNLANHLRVVNTCVELGDIPCARRAIHAVPNQVGIAAAMAYMTVNDGMVPWVLDTRDLQLFVQFGPAVWRDARADWAFAVSEAYDMLGDSARGRAYADTALAATHEAPVDIPEFRAWQATIFARLGMKDSTLVALEESFAGQRKMNNVRLAPFSLRMAAYAYMSLGMVDSATVTLQRLLATPFPVTTAWLRVDTKLARLRELPQFDALLDSR